MGNWSYVQYVCQMGDEMVKVGKGRKVVSLLDELDGGRGRLVSQGSYLFARAYSYRHRYKLFTIQPPK